ncbi:hypothetical protein XELAEV_18004306mg [Xenopus laevis]|uniref:Uncharacterized protein n=1 Tax=Xenopus laevis TaxID=8355 RepID=A0A974BQ28_XENLA|nr:hypothetical protein XELAEV_18004306mg [Xenopus laevis]
MRTQSSTLGDKVIPRYTSFSLAHLKGNLLFRAVTVSSEMLIFKALDFSKFILKSLSWLYILISSSKLGKVTVGWERVNSSNRILNESDVS